MPAKDRLYSLGTLYSILGFGMLVELGHATQPCLHSYLEGRARRMQSQLRLYREFSSALLPGIWSPVRRFLDSQVQLFKSRRRRKFEDDLTRVGEWNSKAETLKISTAAGEMKDRGKDKAMAQTERRRGRRGEGKRRGEKETERQREDTVWGGVSGLQRECTSTVHSFRASRLRTRSGFHKKGNREWEGKVILLHAKLRKVSRLSDKNP